MLRKIKEILIGTNNTHKVAEFRQALTEYRILTPAELGITLDVAENGATFAENAAIKAEAFCKASGLITLADDSGLEVECLNGAPGIFSARYSPKVGANDKNRREFLLQNLAGKPRPWKARFYCAIAIKTPDGKRYDAEGECAGEIIDEERGNDGFGYDPIFYVPELGKTFAEISAENKNRLSHRGNAARNCRAILNALCQ